MSVSADLRERVPRKRGLEAAEGTPEPDEADQQPPRKRHRLATASKSASPAPSAPDAAAAEDDSDAAAATGPEVHGNGTVEAGCEEDAVASPREEHEQPDSLMPDAAVGGSPAGSGQNGGDSPDPAQPSSEQDEQEKGAAQDEAQPSGLMDVDDDDRSPDIPIPDTTELRDPAQDKAAEDGEVPSAVAAQLAGEAEFTEATAEDGAAAEDNG